MSHPMPPVPLTPNPPVNTGDAPGVARDWPTDPPGSRDSAGWLKLSAPTTGGWSRIDDVDDGDEAGWEQT